MRPVVQSLVLGHYPEARNPAALRPNTMESFCHTNYLFRNILCYLFKNNRIYYLFKNIICY